MESRANPPLLPHPAAQHVFPMQRVPGTRTAVVSMAPRHPGHSCAHCVGPADPQQEEAQLLHGWVCSFRLCWGELETGNVSGRLWDPVGPHCLALHTAHPGGGCEGLTEPLMLLPRSCASPNKKSLSRARPCQAPTPCLLPPGPRSSLCLALG